jgi:hypothetical protein
MYKIEKRPSGYILNFSGVINPDEMQRWCDDAKITLNGETSSSFGVIIDMKDLQPLSLESSNIMKQGQRLFKDKGMKRSAVILNSSKICSQFKNIAIQSGIYITERYIDASIAPNPQQLAIDWVKDGIDPDKLKKII